MVGIEVEIDAIDDGIICLIGFERETETGADLVLEEEVGGGTDCID